LPDGATPGEDEDHPPNGQDGAERLRYGSATYFAKFCDGNGYIVEEPTGCREEAAARQVLTDLEPKAERVRARLNSTRKPGPPSTWRGRLPSTSTPA
jgi:hypothetical protein